MEQLHLYLLYSCNYNRSLAGLVTYFIVGGIVLKVKYNKTGTEVIPNKEFWRELPLLIKARIIMYYSYSTVMNVFKHIMQCFDIKTDFSFGCLCFSYSE